MKESNKQAETRFCVGDIVELTASISDGYTEIGDNNVIFPPPTLVKVVELKDDSWFKYGVKVLKEYELPKELQGTQFRTAMANLADNGKITFIGNRQSFFNGDNGIDEEYFNKIYYQPKSSLRSLLKK